MQVEIWEIFRTFATSKRLNITDDMKKVFLLCMTVLEALLL